MIMDSLYAQHERASVTEMVQNMKTYPFSDPDPVANPVSYTHLTLPTKLEV